MEPKASAHGNANNTTQPDIQDIRNMFDHLFLGQAKDATAKDIAATLQATGLESLADIIERNKQSKFFATGRPILDLVDVSMFLYSTADTLPVIKKVELPTENGDYKFIIAGVNTKLEGADQEKPYLIMLATKDKMHVDISANLAERHKSPNTNSELRKALKDFKIKVIGGGRIAVDHDGKNLQANKSSGHYGSLSNELVERFLEDYKKQCYQVGIDMENQGKFGEFDK